MLDKCWISSTTVSYGKRLTVSHYNIGRTSMKQANIAASLQHLDQSLYANSEDELSQDGDLKFEESFQCSTP